MKKFVILATFFFAMAALADSPPLLTDDPNTPGDGHWEINFGVVSSIGLAEQHFETPFSDINYGWGDRVQLKFEIPWVQSYEHHEQVKSGFDTSVAGVKWRFYDDPEKRLLISTYPQQVLAVPAFSKAETGYISETRGLLLPIEVQWRLGEWTFNEDFGTFFPEAQANTFIYGTEVTRAISKRTQLMTEIHGQQAHHENEIFFNFGGAVDVSETYSVLFSAGHSLILFSGDEPSFISYLGVQFHLE